MADGELATKYSPFLAPKALFLFPYSTARAGICIPARMLFPFSPLWTMFKKRLNIDSFNVLSVSRLGSSVKNP